MNNYKKYGITEQEYDRITKSLVQQKIQVRDVYGNRWVKCRFCGEAKHVNECWTYGGIGKMNVGECHECFRRYKLKEQFYYDRYNSR